ncbi:hypothetical protein Palpr_0899 [Paludibacter propionicigenes WB4]|uniref:Uncharacterized protein n=1 Tax=Paludibacter propionicigenes (strain DSM 17365 / JCM 13257 / WB4) TaxID=694427 RepID=E4T2V5_PALPW|nr:hypothetical protein [Paludibacter propionicigenes]ADQ79049.1 hypothetical protein Palpr_0899 [Paludibacter propionicigenes WB4]
MNDYQNAKQASYKLIVKEAKNHPNEVSLIPSFSTGINRFETIVNQIDTVSTEQAKSIKGITDGKNSVMGLVADYLVDVAGAIHSYAENTNNLALQDRVNYKESAISKMAQPDLIKAAAIVIEEADKLGLGALSNEGITPVEMDEFRTAFNQFKEVSSDPREAIIDRSNYTQQLADLFADASKLKKTTLDRLATQFKRKAPEFYAKYKAASMVIYRQAAKSSTEATPKA